MAIRLAFDYLPEDELDSFRAIFCELVENPKNKDMDARKLTNSTVHFTTLCFDTQAIVLYDIANQCLITANLISVISTKILTYGEIWREHLTSLDSIRLQDRESQRNTR